MIIKEGHKYKLIIQIGDRTLVFEGKIKSIDGKFFTFTDIYNNEYTYNFDVLMSVKSLDNENENT